MNEKVFIASPLRKRSLEEANCELEYAKLASRDTLINYEQNPFSPILLIPHYVKENDLFEQVMFDWIGNMDRLVVYQDRGITDQMKQMVQCAEYHRLPVEYRRIHQG